MQKLLASLSSSNNVYLPFYLNQFYNCKITPNFPILGDKIHNVLQHSEFLTDSLLETMTITTMGVQKKGKKSSCQFQIHY